MAIKLAAQTLIIAQGEDKEIQIPVTNAAGTAVDVSAATQIIVGLSSNIGNLKKRYALEVIGGSGVLRDGSLTVGTAPNTNVLTFQLTRANSKDLDAGELRAEVLVTIAGVSTVYEGVLGSVTRSKLRDLDVSVA